MADKGLSTIGASVLKDSLKASMSGSLTYEPADSSEKWVYVERKISNASEPLLSTSDVYIDENTQASEIILSKNWHWRSIKTTTYTIAFTKTMFDKNYSIFTNINRPLFYDHIINLLYVYNKCYSPIPSLTSHIEEGCLSPCLDSEKIFKENVRYFI